MSSVNINMDVTKMVVFLAMANTLLNAVYLHMYL
jgi:hypothetical protein